MSFLSFSQVSRNKLNAVDPTGTRTVPIRVCDLSLLLQDRCPESVRAAVLGEALHSLTDRDVTLEKAQALYQVVMAMHNGICPKCSYLAPAVDFEYRYANAPRNLRIFDHICPKCKFMVTYKEAEAALAAFQPHLTKSIEIFEAWQEKRT